MTERAKLQPGVFDEDAFRCLLAVERKRAERTQRVFLLLLVKVSQQPGERARIAPRVAAAVFAGLWLCLRDMDIVGWFRQDAVAGAVLAQRAHPLARQVARRIGQRVTDTLRAQVPVAMASRLHVRVLQVPRDRRR